MYLSPFPAQAAFALLRPDAIFVEGRLRGFYELKPITHSQSKRLASITAFQMGLYDIALATNALYRGDSQMLLGNVPPMTPIPGGFIYDNGLKFKLTFYAADTYTPVVGTGNGIVYYSLTAMPDSNRPKRNVNRVIRELRVPEWVKDNIYPAPLAPVTIEESRLIIKGTALALGTLVVVELLRALATALMTSRVGLA